MLAATISYYFKFEKDYDLTGGGKMPGFCSEGARLSVDWHKRVTCTNKPVSELADCTDLHAMI